METQAELTQPGGEILARRPAFIDGSLFLAEIFLQQGEQSKAEKTLRQVLQREDLSPQGRSRIKAMLQKLEKPEP